MEIEKPTLLVNKERTLRNIKRIARKAQENGVRFRPHFKTHQSAQIGEWFREFGVTTITTSSLWMAEYFSRYGWDDITVAFPVNILEINKINILAKKIQLSLLVESGETNRFLNENLTSPTDVWIKIDVGYGRTGIPVKEVDRVFNLANEIETARNLHFVGLLTHAGHSYHAKSIEEIKEVHRESIFSLSQLKHLLQEKGISEVQISVGDTPTCSLMDDFSQVDEIRPGNFVFYDLNQLGLGSCREEDITLAVACPVVAKHKERKELVIYGGAVHFSREFLVRNDGTSIFGYVVPMTSDGWDALMEDCYVSSLSQEHGIVKVSDTFFEKTRVGDVLAILPVHSCLTANLIRKYMTLDGEEIIH